MLDQAITKVTNSPKTCYIPGTARHFIFFVTNLSPHPVGRYYFHFLDEVHEPNFKARKLESPGSI